MTDHAITADEAGAFSDKLDAWGTSLPAREQALLRHLLVAANKAAEAAAVQQHAQDTGASTDEVAGFAFDAFVPTSLGRVMNPARAQGYLTVKDLSRTALSPVVGSEMFLKPG